MMSLMTRYLPHAEEQIAGRNIAKAWVEETLARPDWIEQDPKHLHRNRYFRAVPEMGGRVLRVVTEADEAGPGVVTAHPDRGAHKRRARLTR